MTKKQSFMPFFYDWCQPFSALSGEECKELLLAMVDFHQNGGEIPQFSGMAGMAASFIFPQIERARAASVQRAENGAKGGKANGSKSKQTEATNTSTNTITNTNAITNTNTNTDPAGDRERRFAVFWERYPKKENKVAARKAWDKLDPDTFLLDAMLTAIDRQMRSSAWTAEGGRSIPSPTSWLSQRRWEDEVTSLPPNHGEMASTFDANEFAEAAIRHALGKAFLQEEKQISSGGMR